MSALDVELLRGSQDPRKQNQLSPRRLGAWPKQKPAACATSWPPEPYL